MVVCLHPGVGLFFRINTEPYHPSVAIPRWPNHLFLKYDSFLECDDPLELSDYLIEEAVSRGGVIGRISSIHVEEIRSHIALAKRLSRRDKEMLLAVIG